jgi:hypothetical protein
MAERKKFDLLEEAGKIITTRTEYLDKIDITEYEVTLDAGDEYFLAELVKTHFPYPEDTLELVTTESLDPDDPALPAFTVQRLRQGIQPPDDVLNKFRFTKAVAVGLRLRDMDLINAALERQIAISSGENPDYPLVSHGEQNDRWNHLFAISHKAAHPLTLAKDVNKAFQEAGAPKRPSFVTKIEYNR